MTKSHSLPLTVLGAVAVLGAIVAWWSWRATPPPARPGPAAGAADDGAARAATPAAAATSAGERTAVAMPAREPGAPLAVVPPDPELGRVDAWTLEVQVFDDADAPVADAVVEAFAGERVERHDGTAGRSDATAALADVWLGRAPGPPLVAARTGADGRCTLRVERPFVVVAAHHDSYGCSVARGIESSAEPGPIPLWLTRPVLVRGTVLDAELRPAAFATVRVETPRERIDVPAGADGRFRFEAEAGARCTLQARAGGASSARVDVVAQEGTEVTLALAGAFAIVGQVVRADGSPVPGIAVMATAGPAATGGVGCATSDAAGRFVIELPAAGRYRTFAGSLGAASQEVDVNRATPRPEVLLTLPDVEVVSGRVCTATGEPAAEATIRWAEVGRDSASWSQARVAADGSFAFARMGGAFVQIVADAGGRRVAALVTVETSVELVLPAEQGPAVRGTVVRDADGRRVEGFAASWVLPSGERSGSTQSIERQGNAFTAHEVPFGERRWLMVETIDDALAPALAGPFSPGAAPESVTVRLRPWARVPLRVVGPHGEPLRAILVQVQFANLAFSERTDAAGRAVLRVPPGTRHLTAARGAETVGTLRLHAMPGGNAEVVLRVAQ